MRISSKRPSRALFGVSGSVRDCRANPIRSALWDRRMLSAIRVSLMRPTVITGLQVTFFTSLA